MFTGIIEEIGHVTEVSPMTGGIRITVSAPLLKEGLNKGDSISVNGACLTVVSLSGDRFAVEAVEETLTKTTLGGLISGSHVNLERAVRAGDRLGGHLVQGHIDGVGIIKTIEQRADSRMVEIELAASLVRYVITAGSIAVDGVSLTAAVLRGNSVVVSIIPYTLRHTTFGNFGEGTRVNIECDLIGKYVDTLLRGDKERESLSKEMLTRWGYDG